MVLVAVAVAVAAYSRHSLLLAAIGTFRLEGRRYSWRNDPSSEEQGEMAVFAGYCFLRTCSSRKYPYPLPHGGQRKFRGEGEGVRKDAISEVVGVASRGLFFRGLQLRLVSY